MKTHEFIKALRNSADKELIFANADGQSIHAGYHLTEIQAASFETVDCGGKTNRWNETAMKIFSPRRIALATGVRTMQRFGFS